MNAYIQNWQTMNESEFVRNVIFAMKMNYAQLEIHYDILYAIE